jgi:acid phosphatase
MRAAYGRATVALDALLADRAATAALEQKGSFGSLPPAVILDVDETVLDNSRFEGEQIRRGASTFDTKHWDQWVQAARADALPGAVEFLKAARQKGVRTFFVTNRDAAGEGATVANLRQVGIEATAEEVLVKGENGWTSDKTARRAHVAASHRVLMLCGDDLGDFVSVQGLDVAARYAAVDSHTAWWGERWVVLPNPAYGSWERAVSGGGDPLAGKRKAVRGITD